MQRARPSRGARRPGRGTAAGRSAHPRLPADACRDRRGAARSDRLPCVNAPDRLAVDVRPLLHSRWLLLRQSLPRVVQASVAAGLAWWLAHLIPHHPRPFFAPIAAVIAMGAPTGTRGRQAVDLLVGVMLGIGIAAAIAAVVGTGTW